MKEICHVIGYEDYDGCRSYSVHKGKYRGTLFGWSVTSRAIDACEYTNFCCFEGTAEECEEWIKEQMAN